MKQQPVLKAIRMNEPSPEAIENFNRLLFQFAIQAVKEGRDLPKSQSQPAS